MCIGWLQRLRAVGSLHGKHAFSTGSRTHVTNAHFWPHRQGEIVARIPTPTPISAIAVGSFLPSSTTLSSPSPSSSKIKVQGADGGSNSEDGGRGDETRGSGGEVKQVVLGGTDGRVFLLRDLEVAPPLCARSSRKCLNATTRRFVPPHARCARRPSCLLCRIQ